MLPLLFPSLLAGGVQRPVIWFTGVGSRNLQFEEILPVVLKGGPPPGTTDLGQLHPP